MTALPWRVLAHEAASILLSRRRGLATMQRAARKASGAPLLGRKVVQQALLVLTFPKQPLPGLPRS